MPRKDSEGLGSTKTDDLRGKFHLYLRELWLSAHRTYFENAKRKLMDPKTNAIRDRIVESANRCEIIFAGKKEAIHSLAEENNRIQHGNGRMCHNMGGFYSHTFLCGGNVSDVAIELSSVRGEMQRVREI